MVINSNDSDNSSAFEVTDAPHSTVAVESGRIAYNHRKQVLNLADWTVVERMIVTTRVGQKKQRQSFQENMQQQVSTYVPLAK